MIESAYRKVRYYDLANILNLDSSYTLDVSKYRWMKAFAIRIGTDQDFIGTVLTPTISATYYTSNSEITLTNQISSGTAAFSGPIPNSTKSIMGNSTNSGFSNLVIPGNSDVGHTLCKGTSKYESWLWYPYRLKNLVITSTGTSNVTNTALLLLF
jgi:hypothetical protein